jgi:hypothetical protein
VVSRGATADAASASSGSWAPATRPRGVRARR